MKNVDNLWIGPVPYELQNANQYYGKNKEAEKFFELFGSTKILLITGKSGVGKSSFLYGKIVKKIKDNLPDTPLLIVKNWGMSLDLKDVDMESHILQDMYINFGYSLYENHPNKEIDHYSTDIDIEHNSEFDNVPEIRNSIIELRKKILGKGFRDKNSSLKESISIISKNNKGAILIFDQFEEILHNNENGAQNAFNILAKLYDKIPNIRIIVAFRKEYFADFNFLEKRLGGMYGRTIFLDNFTINECKDITIDVLHEMNISIDDKEKDFVINSDVVDSLIKQCEIQSINQQAEKKTSDTVDMLAYQSVMYHLFNYVNEHKPTDGLISDIFIEEFEAYLENKIGSETVKKELNSTADKALYVWFNEAVGKCVEKPIKWQIENDFNTEIDISLPIFMNIVNICPYLSSDTYKSSCDEAFLKKKIVNKNIDFITYVDIAKKHLSGDFRKIIEEDFKDKDKEIGEFLKNNGEDFLNKSLKITLELMQRNKILKSFPIGNNKKWEIRHDKLGRIANIWSEYNIDSINYIKDSFIFSSSTINFSKADITDFNWLRLRAAYIISEKNKKNNIDKLTVNFSNCDFTGSVFENIYFEKCKFKDCNLEGVVFFDCTFKGVDFFDCGFKGTIMKSRGGRKKGNVINGRVNEGGGLEFVDCDIIISEFSDITLDGEWHISNDISKEKSNKDKDKDKEFSLSSIKIKNISKPYKEQKQRKKLILIKPGVKSNNLMVNVEALTEMQIESTRINGLSLLGR